VTGLSFTRVLHLSALNDLKIGEGVLAAFVANHLLGPVRPVGCDRQFDSARILVELAPQNRRVFFFNLAAVEIAGRVPTGSLCAWAQP
jgi:hypothetical protein